MFAMVTENTRRAVSAVAAVAVVAFGGLALDQGHQGALPRGIVEVGELVPLNMERVVNVTLPEVTVTASRLESDEQPSQRVAAKSGAGQMPVLPEVVVVATRAFQVADGLANAVADAQR